MFTVYSEPQQAAMMPSNFLTSLLLLCAFLCAVQVSYAAPSAGELLRQIEKDLAPRSPPRSVEKTQAATAEKPAADEPSMEVKEFDIRGNKLIDDPELLVIVEEYTQRTLSISQLQHAAATLADYYRDKGWAARVFIPKQEIVAGKVILRVVEAAFGSARFSGEFKRINETRLSRMLSPTHEHGDPLRIVGLERSVLLMNDLPGVEARAALQTGEHRGETDLMVELKEAPMISTRLLLDTAGARATGEERAIGVLRLSSPFGYGEQISLTAMATSDSEYARAEFDMPVAYSGLRWGVSASKLDYDLGEQFSNLDASGEAQSLSTQLSYPWIRSRGTNLSTTVGYQKGEYLNTSLGTKISDYVSHVTYAGLQFSHQDDWYGGGLTTAGVQIFSGLLDLTDSPNRLTDAATVRANGAYNKVVLQAGRLQWLSASTQVQVTISGQLASKNLDSSEHFSIGGSRAVRSYPANEASGDEGWLFTAQWRKILRHDLSVDLFYDHGWAKLNHDAGFPGAQEKNTFTLKGVGMALNWQPPSGLDMSAVWSRRLGSNPNPLPDGNDSDGSLEKNRFWFSTSYTF